MKSNTLIKNALAFIIPFITAMILIPHFFDFDVTTNSTLLLGLFAFTIFLMVKTYQKWGHQGQLPIFIGLFFMIGSGIAILGSMGINGSQQLYELSARNQGFALIGFVIGLIFLVSGLKSMSSASYFLGNIGRK